MLIKNYQKINSKIALLVAFILLILLMSIASELVQQFFQQDVPIKSFNYKAVNNSSKLSLPNHLFGKLNSPVKIHKRVKKTRLNLVLVGILNQKNQALAIIKQNNKEKIYKINDAINASASVKAIYSSYIIINHDGNDEKLSIKYRTAFKKTIKTKDREIKAVEPKVEQKKPAKQQSSSEALIDSTDKIKLEEMLSSPTKMLSAITVQPNYKGDDLHGFIVYPGKERILFKKIGLKSGDIILTINGIELDGWIKLISLKRELSKQNFDFVIERKNKQHFLSVNLN